MPSPLIRKLIDEYHYPEVNSENIDDFLLKNHQVVLFFTENPKQFPESNDVAVVLPELMKFYAGQLKIAVVSQVSQRQLQTRYGFSSWPSLVFLRQGQYLGVISQIQNWTDYQYQFNQILNSEPAGIPLFKIPVISESTLSNKSSCNSH